VLVLQYVCATDRHRRSRPLSTAENIHKRHARSPRSETTRPAEGCAITLRALHGAAAAAGTTIVAVVAVTKVSSERAERFRCVCVYYCRTYYKAVRGGGRREDDMCYDRRRAEACVDESAHHALFRSEKVS
jgi:hypothetical protein